MCVKLSHAWRCCQRAKDLFAFLSQDQVRDIIYKGSQEQILEAVRPDGKVPLVCPPVCLSVSLFDRFRIAWLWEEPYVLHIIKVFGLSQNIARAIWNYVPE